MPLRGEPADRDHGALIRADSAPASIMAGQDTPERLAIQRVLGPACVVAQVVKKIRTDRVVKVGTKLVLGLEWKLRGEREHPA